MGYYLVMLLNLVETMLNFIYIDLCTHGLGGAIWFSRYLPLINQKKRHVSTILQPLLDDLYDMP